MRVLEHLGCPDVEIPTVGTARLSSDLNERWRTRFLAETAS